MKGHTTKLIDLSGQSFGRLTVVCRAETPSHVRQKHRAHWTCRCTCGAETVVAGKSLRSGGAQSCGCLRVERNKAAITSHGHATTKAHTRTYTSWRSMRSRCLDKGSHSYPEYGGRGISICQRWESFAAFLEDMGERPAGMSIDRIDVNGNYEPSNCRWATASLQSANTRRALVYEFEGVSLPLIDWAKRLGIDYQTLKTRIRSYGWTPERALTTPVQVHRKGQHAIHV